MFIKAESAASSRVKGPLKDEYELEFSLNDCHAVVESHPPRRQVERLSAQAAYETNSSIGSENCSLESI